MVFQCFLFSSVCYSQHCTISRSNLSIYFNFLKPLVTMNTSFFVSHISHTHCVHLFCLFFFFLFLLIFRMDENYNIVPHGVNFQDPIFPDTAEVHRMFASLFQFSNCTPGTQVHHYSPEWEAQEDSRVWSSLNQCHKASVEKMGSPTEMSFFRLHLFYFTCTH